VCCCELREVAKGITKQLPQPIQVQFKLLLQFYKRSFESCGLREVAKGITKQLPQPIQV
jgi:hypothetical protein